VKKNQWTEGLNGNQKKIMDFIRDNGPASSLEIGIGSGCKSTVRATLCALRNSPKLVDEKVYIHSWRRDTDAPSGQLRLRALYAVGTPDKKDAKKPPRLSMEECRQRYLKKRDTMVNSVFSLGAPSHLRKVRQYGRADERVGEV